RPGERAVDPGRREARAPARARAPSPDLAPAGEPLRQNPVGWGASRLARLKEPQPLRRIVTESPSEEPRPAGATQQTSDPVADSAADGTPAREQVGAALDSAPASAAERGDVEAAREEAPSPSEPPAEPAEPVEAAVGDTAAADAPAPEDVSGAVDSAPA